MNNTIIGILTLIIIFIWTFFICQNINNKELNKRIILLSSLLIFLILIRTIKYSLVSDLDIGRYLWYLYYLPTLFAPHVFLSISSWNKKNQKPLKIFKIISIIISIILFTLVMTNDIHLLVFNMNIKEVNFESNYTYGLGYYLCLIHIFINLIIGIIYAVKGGTLKKQKIIILTLIIILVFMYAISYMINFSSLKIFKDFTVVYSIFYLLALFIVVYKEKYRLALENNLYFEIEESIKNKTMLINKYINNISKSKNKKQDLAYIKLLVSYCKGKSNLIVIKNNEYLYTSDNLKILLDNALKDATCLNINGAVNIQNKFNISINLILIIYDYIYNIFENLAHYKSSDILINIGKTNNALNLKILVTSNKIKVLDYNYEVSKYLNKIKETSEIDNDTLSIEVEIPLELSNIKMKNLTENETKALLHIKAKVHDILGQRLSPLSSLIDNDNYHDIEEIKPLLNNLLDDLNNDLAIDSNKMLFSLIDTCKLAGTNLYIVGELPQNHLKAITLVKIIRECSTNAIRHAKAKNIYVEIRNKDQTEIIISNDGKIPKTIHEGDGLKGIKLRVLELNGQIEIKTSDKFTLNITI